MKTSTNTLHQLQLYNEELKEKIKMLQDNIWCANYAMNLEIENRELKDKIATLNGNIVTLEEKYQKLEILLNQYKTDEYINKPYEEQSGFIYKDIKSDWMFFVNSDKHYFIIRNSRNVNYKSGYPALAKVYNSEFAKIIKVYDD